MPLKTKKPNSIKYKAATYQQLLCSEHHWCDMHEVKVKSKIDSPKEKKGDTKFSWNVPMHKKCLIFPTIF